MASINPDPARLSEILSGIPRDKSITMLNLLRFRAEAAYPAGPDGSSPHPPCSGREAYARYSRVALQTIAEVGGSVQWMGAAAATIIGPADEQWDSVILVNYPSIEAFLRMISLPHYREASIHRTVALEDSRLIATITP